MFCNILICFPCVFFLPKILPFNQKQMLLRIPVRWSACCYRFHYISKKHFRAGGMAPSEPSETPQWRITPRLASTPRVALHTAIRLPFRRFFSLCQSPISNKHSGIVANCDHTSAWVHWVYVCIGIAMGDAAKISPRVPSTLSSRSRGR